MSPFVHQAQHLSLWIPTACQRKDLMHGPISMMQHPSLAMLIIPTAVSQIIGNKASMLCKSSTTESSQERQSQNIEKLRARHNDSVESNEKLRLRIDDLESTQAYDELCLTSVERWTQVCEEGKATSMALIDDLPYALSQKVSFYQAEISRLKDKGCEDQQETQKIRAIVGTTSNNDKDRSSGITDKVVRDWSKRHHPRYGKGHRLVNPLREDSTWTETRKAGSPSTPLGTTQALFEQSTSDTMLIYDACNSADTAMSFPPSDAGITPNFSPHPGAMSFAPGPEPLGRQSEQELILSATFRIFDGLQEKDAVWQDWTMKAPPGACLFHQLHVGIIPSGHLTD
ncbi:hypothetical protein WAI453_001159 [Rhynchosporium graminicola]